MAEDYDVTEEDREEVKLRKSQIYCRFIIYIMTSLYHFASGKYTCILYWHLLWSYLELCSKQHYKVTLSLILKGNLQHCVGAKRMFFLSRYAWKSKSLKLYKQIYETINFIFDRSSFSWWVGPKKYFLSFKTACLERQISETL